MEKNFASEVAKEAYQKALKGADPALKEETRKAYYTELKREEAHPKKGLTVGQLKALLADLPDDMPFFHTEFGQPTRSQKAEVSEEEKEWGKVFLIA